MFYIVSYDIPDTPRRTKIAKISEDFGEQVQFSVFECLLDHDLLERMVGRLENVAKTDEDRIRIYALCGSCERVIKIIGQGVVTKDEKYFIL